VRRPVALGDGVFVCGDHRDTPSIQGALVSGRRAAAAVHEALGGP
jgi:predicted NAD/FAD-dependent oxidoreductase